MSSARENPSLSGIFTSRIQPSNVPDLNAASPSSPLWRIVTVNPFASKASLRERAKGKIVVNKEKVHGGGCLPAEARSAKEGELVYCLPALAFPPAESWRAGAKEGDLGSWRLVIWPPPSHESGASAGKLAHKHRQVWWFSDARKTEWAPIFTLFYLF